MLPPKPRIISLEPIPKHSKRSIRTKSKAESEAPDAGCMSESVRRADSPVPDESASQRGQAEQTIPPRSPVNSDGHSDVSGESVVSNSTGLSFRVAPPQLSSKSGRDNNGAASSCHHADKTITATIELLKAGCLPGDSVPLKISIHHTRRIKSMHGIIITLYRQGRIDSAPPLSLFADIRGDMNKMKHEEYYPKSKTGLGGLSLSSAGSSSVFRKDLSQTFAPIIIDPITLSTVVTASVRVPADVFPTITGVPGQMINFRYHIEVVVDLGGRLAGQDRHIPRLGMMSLPSNFVNGSGPIPNREDGSDSMLAAWGGSIVDTDNIRREKSIVACLFEIIVGTTDSVRSRRRGNTNSINEQVEPQDVHSNLPHFIQADDNAANQIPHEASINQPNISPNGQQQGEQEPHSAPSSQSHSLLHQCPRPSHQPSQSFVPLPEIPTEEGLTEKERMRRAEVMLLPSRPPEDGGGSSSEPASTASAPGYQAEEVPYYLFNAQQIGVDVPTLQRASSRRASDISAPFLPSVTLDLHDPTEHITNTPAEDKQELERLRLIAEASWPPNLPEDEDVVAESSNSGAINPSAPLLSEEDEYGGRTVQHNISGTTQHQESLPRYER